MGFVIALYAVVAGLFVLVIGRTGRVLLDRGRIPDEHWPAVLVAAAIGGIFWPVVLAAMLIRLATRTGSR